MIIDTESFKTASKKKKVLLKCDYCGKQFERTKNNILRSHTYTSTDACPKCTKYKKIDTFQKTLGVDNPFQAESVKESIKLHHLETTGYDNPMKNPVTQLKQVATVEKIYGTKNVFQNEDIKEKTRQKHQEVRGVDNPMQCPIVQKNHSATIESLYGVKHYSQTEGFGQQVIETTIANYGRFPVGCYGKAQAEVQDWLNSFGFNFKSSTSLIPGREIDLYDENKALAAEYCGIHWHHEKSREPRLRNYHYDKYLGCLAKGVQLLTIFSDEWKYREFQCKSHIKSILGISERIFARKCEIKEISKEEGRKFIDLYHIQGSNRLGVVFFGLFYDELVGVISLGKHHRGGSTLVLDRLCFKDGIQVVGGASKLFKRCVEWSKGQSIVSFSDNRWSLGGVYEKMGFRLDKEYRPDYAYVSISSPTKRLSKQSQKDKKTGLTELEWSIQNNLARIWDCGKKRWVFNLE